MFGLISSAVLLAFGYLIYYCVSNLQRNLKDARETGLPIVIVPFHPWNNVHKPFITFAQYIFEKLPESYKPPRWITISTDFMDNDTYFHHPTGDLYDESAGGGDHYIIVSPNNLPNVFVTRDPVIIADIAARRNDFGKPLEVYTAVNIYGNNVVTTEGDEWKRHRKIVGPPFNERNNGLVWKESIRLAQLMLEGWKQETQESLSVKTMDKDCERITLFIISKAGFGVSMKWPKWRNPIADNHSAVVEEEDDEKLGPGHVFSYDKTMSILQRGILMLIIIPRWFLKNSPFRYFKDIYTSYGEFASYITEMIEEERKNPIQETTTATANLLTNFVKASAVGTGKQVLTEQEILGNSFVMILAGHETSSHTIHYALLELAINPQYQIILQQAIERVGGGRPVSEWRYPEDFLKLEAAVEVFYETLRLYAPISGIIKRVTQSTTAVFKDSMGKEIRLTPGLSITFDAVNVHRHKRIWGDDSQQFDPLRWRVKSDNIESDQNHVRAGNGSVTKQVEPGEESLEDEKRTDESVNHTSKNLFKPPKGSFIPFSEGARACLGRKFALVETVAILAILFESNGVELALNDNPKERKEWIRNEDVQKLGREKATKLGYERKVEYARDKISGSFSVVTLQMAESIDVKWVPKGTEVWRQWMK